LGAEDGELADRAAARERLRDGDAGYEDRAPPGRPRGRPRGDRRGGRGGRRYRHQDRSHRLPRQEERRGAAGEGEAVEEEEEEEDRQAGARAEQAPREGERSPRTSRLNRGAVSPPAPETCARPRAWSCIYAHPVQISAGVGKRSAGASETI